jgi:hypothetical protein
MIVFGAAVMLCGGLLLAGACGIPLFQCARWLKEGAWTRYEVRCFWGGALLHSERAGIARIVNGFSTLPLSVGAAMAAPPVMSIGAFIIMSAHQVAFFSGTTTMALQHL